MPDPTPTPEMVAAAPRWVASNLEPGTINFVAPDGRLLGWVEQRVQGWRGFFIYLFSDWRRLRIEDHLTEPAARAWVEAQVGRPIGVQQGTPSAGFADLASKTAEEPRGPRSIEAQVGEGRDGLR